MKVSDYLANWLELERRVTFTFDKRIARYRNSATGRLVSESKMLQIAESYTDDFVIPRMQQLADALVDGRMDLPAFERAMAREIKDSWIVETMAGRGGRNAMTASDWGRVGGRLRYQYNRFNAFAADIKAGTLTPEQIKYRVQLYANAARTGYYDGKTAAQQDAGMTFERRVLNPAEHCDDCLGYAAQGWQPIGTLPEPGQASQCQVNCQCTKEYTNDPR